MEPVEILEGFRHNYLAIKSALPWLDSCIWKDDKPAFPGFAKAIETDFVESLYLDSSLAGKLSHFRSKNALILRYDPNKGSLDSFNILFPEIAENKIPLAILHTDVGFDELMIFANKNREINIIIECGPRKILYFFEKIKEVLKACKNIFLCTYNFCNWLGHEQLCDMGFCDRLIYGSHMPAFNNDVSMGPVIMSHFSWEDKCDIAGNNLRRLLGEKPVYPVEIKYILPQPFIVDTHTHCIHSDYASCARFYTPDLDFEPADWIRFMDLCGLDQIYLMPLEALFNSEISCRERMQWLIEHSANRFSYLEVFNPNGDDDHVRKFEASLSDPKCLGIKIHPVEHKTDGDDEKYRIAYKMARKFNMPIMTHSWENSSYNPQQYRSHPDRFKKFLVEFNELTFVLGHAGGRPSTADSVMEICSDFKNVYVDIAGDYYDNGLVEMLSTTIGVEKILFGSDVNWMDTRCNLAPVLSSKLDATDILKILRLNALKVFKPE